jgi:hypothetical protein
MLAYIGIHVSHIKNSPIFCTTLTVHWLVFIIEQSKILRMKVQIESQIAPELLNHLLAEIRVHHYNIRTEETYVDWARRFIL